MIGSQALRSPKLEFIFILGHVWPERFNYLIVIEKINCSLKRQSRYVEYLVIMYSTCIRKISNMPNVKLV